jgi:hypothetical protein
MQQLLDNLDELFLSDGVAELRDRVLGDLLGLLQRAQIADSRIDGNAVVWRFRDDDYSGDGEDRGRLQMYGAARSGGGSNDDRFAFVLVRWYGELEWSSSICSAEAYDVERYFETYLLPSIRQHLPSPVRWLLDLRDGCARLGRFCDIDSYPVTVGTRGQDIKITIQFEDGNGTPSCHGSMAYQSLLVAELWRGDEVIYRARRYGNSVESVLQFLDCLDATAEPYVLK